jgi:glycosyltransferase involved in cell wall biosynthesis
MSTASIFWSATGYGEDEERAPWAHEHFGMTTAEAMAGGCVPVVIDKAGQREIVRDGEHGFRWLTPEELADRTLQVAGDPELRARMSAASVQRAQQYSDEAFARRWRDVVAAHDLLGRRV